MVSELEAQLPFSNTNINLRSCAYKLLVTDKMLNDVGKFSKKHLDSLCDVLIDAAKKSNT